MVSSVAPYITPPGECPEIFERKAAETVGTDDMHIKVDQVRVVGSVALGIADPVRIMTHIAGRSFLNNMPVVFERIVVQYGGAVVTGVTQLIGQG